MSRAEWQVEMRTFFSELRLEIVVLLHRLNLFIPIKSIERDASVSHLYIILINKKQKMLKFLSNIHTQTHTYTYYTQDTYTHTHTRSQMCTENKSQWISPTIPGWICFPFFFFFFVFFFFFQENGKKNNDCMNLVVWYGHRSFQEIKLMKIHY